MSPVRPVKMNRDTGKIRISSGFSLVEMAIVLMILGLILGGLLGAIGQSTESTRRLEAKNQLREIEEALYGFAQVQGRLPCPSDWDSSGAEDVTSPTTGTCGLYNGLLPNATLGLSGSVDENGFMMDPWGNPYRYSVALTTPNGSRYTGTTGIQSIYTNAATQIVNNGGNMLSVCNNAACSDVIMIDVAPAVVLSMGNNYGSITTASADEVANAGGVQLNSLYWVTTTREFVVTGYSEENFDDMLVWISPHLLLSKLITAGKLP